MLFTSRMIILWKSRNCSRSLNISGSLLYDRSLFLNADFCFIFRDLFCGGRSVFHRLLRFCKRLFSFRELLFSLLEFLFFLFKVRPSLIKTSFSCKGRFLSVLDGVGIMNGVVTA